jgi:hypothetical protein
MVRAATPPLRIVFSGQSNHEGFLNDSKGIVTAVDPDTNILWSELVERLVKTGASKNRG